MKHKFFNVNKLTAGRSEMLVYGVIGDHIESGEFVRELKNLEKDGLSLDLRVNCPGGVIYEGIAIRGAIDRYQGELDLYIDGLAASMGSVILYGQSMRKIYMNKYARLMIHRASGRVEGDCDDMSDGSNELQTLDADLAEIYSKRTGKTVQEVKDTWMKRGAMKWFTAQQAFDEGLIDGIFDGMVAEIPESNVNPQEIWNSYNNSFTNKFDSTMKNPIKFINLLVGAGINLNADADEDQILSHVTSMVNSMKLVTAENSTLKTRVAELEKATKDAEALRITDMLNSAVADKRITEAEKPTFEALLKADFVNAEKLLKSKQAYSPMTAQLKTGQSDADARKDWKLSDYETKASNDLIAMRNAADGTPERTKYVALFKEAHGVEPRR